MTSRIRQLELAISAEDRDGGVESAAVAFTRRVFERADELLEAKAPGRVVLVRELETKWRLLRGALALDAEVDAFAERLAEHLHRSATEALAAAGADAVPLPREDAEVVAFETEDAWRAAWILSRAHGTRPWWLEASEDVAGDPVASLARVPDRVLTATLLRLSRAGAITEGLAAFRREAWRKIADRLSKGARPRADDAPAGSERGAESPAIAAADALLPGAGAYGVRPTGDEHVALDAIRDAVERLAGGEPSASTAGSAPSRGRRRDGIAAERETIASRFGGLFYLLNPLLELGAAEILWKACVAEKPVLARALALLLGPEGAGDPAPEIASGAPTDEPFVAGAEAQEEIARSLLAEVASAFPRRGLATLPALELRRVGGLLVAMPEGSPYALYAAPAGTPPEARSALATFLDRWPRDARLSATGALVELDRSGRLRRLRGEPAAPALPDLPPVESAVVAQVAGCAAALFFARAGGLAAFLPVPADVESGTDEINVRMPMERIELDIRRAGLDRNPGVVPWLEKTVRFEFVP